MAKRTVKTITVRLDAEDLETMKKVQKHTGIRSQAQVLVSSMYSVLRKVEGEIQSGWEVGRRRKRDEYSSENETVD